MLTPGAYLKHRRTAQRLSVADVAAALPTDPRMSEHERIAWIELIEADAAPMTFATIVALRRVFRFDLGVLATLEGIRQGDPLPAPRLCRICSCSEWDPCDDHGRGCGWVAQDLCSACAPPAVLVELKSAAA